MEKKFKLGVIGAGFMSTAIINGVIKSGILSPNDIIVSDINENSLKKLQQDTNVSISTDNLYIANNSEFVLFAIKPQNLCDVLKSINGCACNKFISIMAGVKKQKIKNVLKNSLVARCMPNTPCSVGNGAVGIDLSDFNAIKSDSDFILNLFTSFATTVIVSEDKLNTVTGISGSSPAYFYLFLKGIVDAGVKNGLSEQDALKLAANTMIGSGKMVLENKDKTLDELINAVCSKGGTTIEAINVYKQNNLSNITEKAIDACINRAVELENLLWKK